MNMYFTGDSLPTLSFPKVQTENRTVMFLQGHSQLPLEPLQTTYHKKPIHGATGCRTGLDVEETLNRLYQILLRRSMEKVLKFLIVLLLSA